MSREIQVRMSLQVRNQGAFTQTQPTSFFDDQLTVSGASPGYLDVPIGGITVDLSKLSAPGWCRITNLDSSATLYWGVMDPVTGKCYLPCVIPPVPSSGNAMSNMVKLSEFVQEELSGTGTHELSPLVRLFLTAGNTTCKALVEAFES